MLYQFFIQIFNIENGKIKHYNYTALYILNTNILHFVYTNSMHRTELGNYFCLVSDAT